MTEVTKKEIREAALKTLDDHLSELETDENGLIENNGGVSVDIVIKIQS